MNIGVLADIHGNYPALKAIVEHIKNRYTIETWVVAGDICGHFPMVDEVIELLKELDAICIIGNHDYSLLYDENKGLEDFAYQSIQQQRLKISQSNLEYLKELPVQRVFNLAGKQILLIHAGYIDPLLQRVHCVDRNLIEYAKNKIMILGHNHKVFLHIDDDSVILSPGSVGFPLLGFRYASGMVYNIVTKSVTTIEIPYDKTALMDSLVREKYNNLYIEALKNDKWGQLNTSSSSNKTVIIGASTYGGIISEIVNTDEKILIVGYIDDTPEKQGTLFCGIPILGKLDSLKKIAKEKDVDQFIVAIGDNNNRKIISKRIINMGFKLGTVIHPNAVISDSAQISDGVIIDALSYIGPNVIIGQGVTIWPHAMISHDCIIEDFSAVMPGVVLAGFSKVKSLAKVKTGSIYSAYSIIENIECS